MGWKYNRNKCTKRQMESSREYRWKRSPPSAVVDAGLSIWSQCPWRVQQADTKPQNNKQTSLVERFGGHPNPDQVVHPDPDQHPFSKGPSAPILQRQRQLSTLFNMAQFKPEWFEGETEWNKQTKTKQNQQTGKQTSTSSERCVANENNRFAPGAASPL